MTGPTQATTLLVSLRKWRQEIEQSNNLALERQVVGFVGVGISYEAVHSSSRASVPGVACWLLHIGKACEHESPRSLREYPYHLCQRPGLQQVLKRPQRGGVPNQHHPLPIALGSEWLQEAAHPRRNLRITLALGKRSRDG